MDGLAQSTSSGRRRISCEWANPVQAITVRRALVRLPRASGCPFTGRLRSGMASKMAAITGYGSARGSHLRSSSASRHVSNGVRRVAAVQDPPEIAQGAESVIDRTWGVGRAGPALSVGARLGEPAIPLRPDLVRTNRCPGPVTEAHDPFLNVLAALLDRRERRHALEVAVGVLGEGRLAERGERRSDAGVEADPFAPASPVSHEGIRRKRRGEEPGPGVAGSFDPDIHLPLARRQAALAGLTTGHVTTHD